jgi:hypothetical protein
LVSLVASAAAALGAVTPDIAPNAARHILLKPIRKTSSYRLLHKLVGEGTAWTLFQRDLLGVAFKVIPVAGGVIHAGLNYAALHRQAGRLQRELSRLARGLDPEDRPDAEESRGTPTAGTAES